MQFLIMTNKLNRIFTASEEYIFIYQWFQQISLCSILPSLFGGSKMLITFIVKQSLGSEKIEMAFE